MSKESRENRMSREKIEIANGNDVEMRVMSKDHLVDGLVVPQYSIDHGERGIFVGQPDSWIPILTRDNLIPDNLAGISVITLKPKRGTKIVVREYEGKEEGFILSEKPLKPIKVESARNFMRKINVHKKARGER